ncbi:MAG: alpha-2-macroglobulin family protein [Bacteroidetes bacterium]|nr:alpha-2-macroglobulin family protein [Bacteroidota bacterium]
MSVRRIAHFLRAQLMQGFLLSALLLLLGCSSSNTVEIVSFSPKGEVPLLATIEIEFSKDLAPPEKQHAWLTDSFVEFHPAIPGRFKWTSARRLLFSPDVPLEAIQEYEAEVTDAVLFATGYDPDFETFTFHTPDFDAVKADVFWTHIPHQYYTVTVQANLHFNYAVQPDLLREHLEVLCDGEEIADIRIVSDRAAEVMAIALGEVKQKDAEQLFTIRVREGLHSVVGKKPLQDTREFRTALPPITQLAVTGVASGYDGNTGWIEVATTQMIDEEKLGDYVRVDPGRKLEFFVSDNIFRIEGDFGNEQTVDLIVGKGLPGLFGGVLEQEYRRQVSFVDIQPAVNFADRRGRYLMRGGEKNLEVHAVNVDELEIETHQVYANNVLHFLNQHRWYDDDYGYNPNYYVGDFGRELYKETVQVRTGRNWLGKHVVSVDKVLESRHKGIYVIRVSSSEDRWIQDSKIVALSDLALIARVADDQITVFVNGIGNARPVEGVEIAVISSDNQTMFDGRTDANGAVVFNDVRARSEGFVPRLVTAITPDDFNFLDLEDARVETSRFDVGGLIRPSSDYVTFLYGERDLYRPGETANISAIVRTDDIGVVSDVPVILKILSPRGRPFREYKLVLNREGSFVQPVEIPDYALTGVYRVELSTGGDRLIGTSSFSVEEFVPDKIRVRLSAEERTYRPGDEVHVAVDAEFLFGARAAALPYQADVQLRHRPYRSKAYPKYSFEDHSVQNTRIENVLLEGTLDNDGHADLRYSIPSDIQAGGILEGAVYVSVFDLTGRTVNRVQPFIVHPNSAYIGVKSPGSYFGVNKQIDFRFVAVDRDDRARKNFAADLRLVRLEWQTVLKKDYSGRYYYASEEKEVLEWEKRVTLNGETPYGVTVRRSGKYELRIAKAGMSTYQKTTFYAYGWATSTASSFEVDKEGRVDIVFDKESYRPGENAKVLFLCPFGGRLLITVERNGVYHHQYVDVDKRSVEITLPVKGQYLPNAYVTATLFRPHSVGENSPFLVGHGFASMAVEKSENRLPVTISASEKVKPGTKQTITITTARQRNVYVTLAVVDEGILQISDFRSPDPYETMYARRALAVSAHDLYKFLLPEIVRTSSSTGGGDDMLEEAARKRTNPITTQRFRLFSYWSGIQKSDGNGKVRVTITLPQFNGEARLMAVAYTGGRFGAAERRMKIADDIILEPQVPRLLTAGDSLLMPVTVINTTGKSGKVTVSLKTEGDLAVRSASSATVVVPANGTAQAQFRVAAGRTPGKASLRLSASGIDDVHESFDLSIRPRVPFSVETRSGPLKNGSTVTMPRADGYVQGTRDIRLTVSPFPAIRFTRQLRTLVGYPYGCIEQIVSRAFPQLYLEEVLKLAAPEQYRQHNPVYYVNEAIRRVESMQRYDGAMTYWPGGGEKSWWGSVYAAHFLIEARKAKYRVSDQVLSRLLRYVSKEAKSRETYDYAHRRGSGRTVELKARKEILYSLYVLALAGKADLSTMNYYKSRPHLLTRDTQYLLAGAYALSGKWSSYHQTIPGLFRAELPERETGRSFDSELRANAVMLNVLLEVDPSNKQIPDILRWITGRIDNMYSTQETAFVMLALGKAARRSAGGDLSVSVLVDGKKRATYDGKSLALGAKELGGGAVTLKAAGSGEVYYYWRAEGVKLHGDIPEVDANMRVRRQYYDYRSGQPLATNAFRQGQLVVCKISLSGEGRSVDNIAVTDLVPACCEIENPRLRPATALGWSITNNLRMEYMDVRDDRIILFTSLDGSGTREFVYLLRVVNAGRFVLPPIGAEAMYDPGFRSYHGAGTVDAAPMSIR